MEKENIMACFICQAIELARNQPLEEVIPTVFVVGATIDETKWDEHTCAAHHFELVRTKDILCVGMMQKLINTTKN